MEDNQHHWRISAIPLVRKDSYAFFGIVILVYFLRLSCISILEYIFCTVPHRKCRHLIEYWLKCTGYLEVIGTILVQFTVTIPRHGALLKGFRIFLLSLFSTINSELWLRRSIIRFFYFITFRQIFYWFQTCVSSFGNQASLQRKRDLS
jgi:hypothetical protein